MSLTPNLCSACGQVVVTGTVTTTETSTARTSSIQRVNTATTTTVAAGAQSYTFVVVSAASAASPTINGVAVVPGVYSWSANDTDTLNAATLVTQTGDDVIILKVV